MIVQKSRYIRKHVVGGGGIFDTIPNIVQKVIGNAVGNFASELLVSAGKSIAPEAGKRLASRFIAHPSPGLSRPRSSALAAPTVQPMMSQPVTQPDPSWGSPPPVMAPIQLTQTPTVPGAPRSGAIGVVTSTNTRQS
jgi:hypothetical protein